MDRIHDWLQEIKSYAETLIGEWGLIIIIILACAASYALGRLSALEGSKPPVAVYRAPGTTSVPTMPLGGEYVASRTGHTYYFPWCGSAQNIAPAKQVWFKTEEAAQKAGYSPAKNCKGLSSD